jgi:hypothetical protein
LNCFWNSGFFYKNLLKLVSIFGDFNIFQKIIEFATQNFQILGKCEKKKEKKRGRQLPFGVFIFQKFLE